MAVKYKNYSDAASDVIKYKKWYQEADASGDDAAKANAHKNALNAYAWLRNNGYKKDANTLEALDYTGSKKWFTDSKVQTRPYLYGLGQKYGLNKESVDNIIHYDDLTGNVSIGGKNIGRPDLVIDGVSYWNDTSTLDSAFDDYITRSGTTIPTDKLILQHNTGIKNKVDDLWALQNKDHSDLTNMYKDEYDSIKNTNPFTTEEAKAILNKYSLAGLQGRDNAVASGSSSNGGNIDSYAAANALRQQASLVNQGQMAVLQAHQQKLDNARTILENLGVYQQNNYSSMQETIKGQQTESQRLFENEEASAQRKFENEETAKNNEVARLQVQADTTGYVPAKWSYSNNPYFNSDGTLNEIYMSDDFDNTGGFTTIINNAREKLNESTDPTERANLEATIKYATQAKAYKTLRNSKYAPYAHEVSAVTPDRTEASRQFDINNETVLKSLDTDASLQKYAIDADMAMSEAANQTDIMLQEMKNEVTSAKASSGGKSSSSGGKSSSSSGSGSGSSSKTLDLSTNMKDFIKKVNDYAIETVGFKVLDSKGNRLNNVDDEFLANRLSLAENLSETELRLFNDYWGIPNGVNDTVKTDPHYKR